MPESTKPRIAVVGDPRAREHDEPTSSARDRERRLLIPLEEDVPRRQVADVHLPVAVVVANVAVCPGQVEPARPVIRHLRIGDLILTFERQVRC